MKILLTQIARILADRGEYIATAESCTGGLIAKLLTDLPGSSDWFERGLVTYSNLAKQELLDVPEEVIEAEGAVSEATVQTMVEGLLVTSPADWGIAVTGIAGPGGGTAEKPAGTVWIAWLHRGSAPTARLFRFDGDREQVREQTAAAALEELLKLLQHG